MREDWFAEVREGTQRLVAIRSVSPGSGERSAAEEVLRMLQEGGLVDSYTASGLDALQDDPYERRNAYALLRGNRSETVVVFGHLDTVDTKDYGTLEPWALDCAALNERLDQLAAGDPEIAADLVARPGDWLFGRGAADMKSGVAITIAVLRRLAADARRGKLPLSVLLLATADEEHESAGILQGVRLLHRLRDQYGLTYVGAINTDYTTDRYPNDPHRYLYTGTIGKLLPSFLVIGAPTHAGAPFDGLDANLLAAELIRDLSMNDQLCDTVRGQQTPPPVTLHARDLKDRYDTQVPFMAAFSLNVLTFSTPPGELLERLHGHAQVALGRVMARIDAARERWDRASGLPVARPGAVGPPGVVLSFAELRAEVASRLGMDSLADDSTVEWARWPATLDSRERCLRLVRRLWILSGRAGSAVVLYFAPPYYPHVAATPSPLHTAVAEVAAAHSELKLVVDEYFPLLSDMSYLRLEPGTDLTALRANMPIWADGNASQPLGAYSLPLEEIASLAIPVVNIGPYGKGAHQRGERVLMSYSFGEVPGLINETIERLARILSHE